MKPSAKPVTARMPSAETRGALFTAAWRDSRTWLGGVCLCVVVFCAHANDLGSGFNYDDQVNIVDNPNFRGLGLTQLRWMVTTFHLGHYQPLSWVTLGLDYVLWGENPRGYHLTNLILHVANAVLVYLLALAVLGAGPAGDQTRTYRLPWIVHVSALIATFWFALHPLRVESVAWVTERRDVLSSLFLLLAVLFYLHAQGGAAITRHSLWIGLSLVVYAVSLLSRALGVTFPAVLLLLDWYPLRRIGGRAGGWTCRAAGRVCAEKLPFALLAVIFVLVALPAARSSGATATLAEHGLLDRAAQACYGLVFYLWKTAAPFGLSPLYELRFPLKLLSAKYILSGVLVLTALVVLLRYGRRWPWLTAVVLIYAVILAPVLGLVQSGTQEVADRYSYLPGIGWALLLGAGLLRLWQDPRRHAWALTCTTFTGAVLAGLAALTWQQNRVWRTPEALWSQAVRQAPSATAYCALAGVYTQAGRLADAISQYRAALRLEPSDRDAWRGLAKTLIDTHQLDEAEQIGRQLVQYDPGDVSAHFLLANVFRARRDLDEAIRHYREAARLDPSLFEAHLNLGGALAERGQTDEAISALRRALDIQPHHAGARYNLATALLTRGDLEAAMTEYRQALAVRPDFPEARLNLALALEKVGQRQAALAELRTLLQSHPDHAEARRTLEALMAPTTRGP
jgi:tetratricopeptide (TPR) repeat protein